jgi:transcriptional regulator with XRE-family HTH domain
MRDHVVVTVAADELAGCLRAWRERVGPAEAGLPVGSQRRVPGLRREEVAQLAGVSVDYLARLEQGRASSPSASVLAALARALRLTAKSARTCSRWRATPSPTRARSTVTSPPVSTACSTASPTYP